MALNSQLALSKYVDPIVAIGKEYTILFANNAAVDLWGEAGDKKCYEFIHNRTAICPLCVKDDLQANNRSSTVRRCRFVKAKNGRDEERYAIVAPFDSGQQDKCHLEIFTRMPDMVLGTRAIMVFAEQLEKLAGPADIFRTLVEFLSSDRTNLRCRTRCYSLQPNNHTEEFRLIFRDDRADGHPYDDDIDDSVISRESTGEFNASFACIDLKRWFILTPEVQKTKAFEIHFRAKALADPKGLWNADITIAQQPISLYLYEKERNGIISIFKDKIPHTFLDIPICTKKKNMARYPSPCGRVRSCFTGSILRNSA